MEWAIALGSAAGGVLVSLIVTSVFNKIIGIPKKWKQEQEIDRAERADFLQKARVRDDRLDQLEKQHQTYRQAQKDLKSAHDDILNTCSAILNRISDLESRNKNALHAKILEEYRLFTDVKKNPRKEWSEMEHHSFFQLVRDYESLGGNNFIHSVVVPEMNQLGVVPMADLEGLKILYASRQIE